jgi:hypothetical protein
MTGTSLSQEATALVGLAGQRCGLGVGGFDLDGKRLVSDILSP